MPSALLSPIDIAILVGYLVGMTGFGCLFWWRNRSSDQFMSAGRSLPAWAVGLSLFGSYVSSISFLANPGKSFADNWNPFVFALSIPLACWVATRYFVPFYRRGEQISAYEHFEARFGAWARTYAVTCFLLMQVARLGTITFLLALALQPLVGIGLVPLILILGLLIMIYPMLGGTEAVIWTGVVQAVILLVGPLLCLIVLALKLPGGTHTILERGEAAGKFSLGTFAPDFHASSFWVVLFYGLALNLQNFGIDQGYVQRYITAKDDKAANRSVWMGGMLYLPVGGLFFFIGTALWAFYTKYPALLPAGTRPDAVFPYFIQTQLPVGLKGLVLAAVCAAAMDSNLNCSATLFLNDVYERYWRPQATEREKMGVLRLSTLGFGVLSTLTAIAMISVRSALDSWWELAGILSGGMLGLFLLGQMSHKVGKREALPAVIVGVALTLWLTFASKDSWPPALQAFKSPFHPLLTIVVGTVAIVGVGLALRALKPVAPTELEPGQGARLSSFSMQTPFSGIIPPIVTPLRNRDELDERGLERLLEHVLDGGVKGIFALGTTGEGPSLSYRLRRHMVERTIEIVAGRVPVLVGITDTAFEESVALANYAAHCGATALVLAPPYYFAPRQPELLEYVEDLVSQLPLPTFLYNMPGLTKVHFELETVRRLSQLEKICGVKDSSGDFIYFQHLLRLARAQRSDWPVLMGPEELLGVAVLAGGDGGICGGANAFPKLYVALFEAAKKGDLPRVQTLQNAVLTLTTELYSVGKYGSSVIKGIKGALAALEICQSEMAEPFHSFHEPERVKVRAILEHLKAVLPTELAPATL